MAYELYLAHHGRLRQQWGVRHGPPYPLKPGAFNGSAVSVSKNKMKSVSGSKIDRNKIYKDALKRTNGDKYEAAMAVGVAERSVKNKEKMDKAKAFITKIARGTEEGFGKVGDKIAKTHANYKAEKAAKIEAKKEQERIDKAAEHEKFLKTATAKELLARQDEFTTQELQEAINRIQKRNTLSGIDDSTKSAGKKFLDDTMKILKNVNDYADTSIKTYNNIAKLYNTFSSDESPKMKVIKDNNKKPQNNNNNNNQKK